MATKGRARCALGMGAVLAAQVALAQTAMSPPQEYGKYIDHAGSIEGFADFGDQVNLRDGSLQVRYTDFELTGNGPTIRFTRTYRPGNHGELYYETSGNSFGLWELEIPRIKTSTANSPGVTIYSPQGWQVIGSTSTEKNARCTRFSAPGRVTFINDAARGWDASEWWGGYDVVDDRGDAQALMSRNDTSVRSDIALMTSGNWLVGCLTATANGEPGEAFQAIAPDGTKYWFDELVYTAQDMLQKPLWTDPLLMAGGGAGSGTSDGTSSGTSGAALGQAQGAVQDRATGIGAPVPQTILDRDQLERRYAAMLVTRIEDRFGNWVDYDYEDGQLQSIDASDGRHVGLSWNALTSTTTVTVGSGASAQTWTYAVDTLSDLTVTRPDGSQWVYDLPILPASALNVDTDPTASCTVTANDYDQYETGTIAAPSGATLTITLNRKRFARSFVPRECWGGDPTVPYNADGYAVYPREWYAFAVVEREVAGPGLPTMTWTYDYAPPVSSWEQDCAAPAICASTVWTDVTAPDGSRRRMIYSNRFDETENKLKREEDYTASSQLLRAIDHEYATATVQSNPYPWPVRVGEDKRERVNRQTSGQWAPERQKVVSQQGGTFTWEVPATCGAGAAPCFDAFARATRVARTGAVGLHEATRTEDTTYADNTVLWVLGQVAQVKCVAPTALLPAGCGPSGTVMSTATYDATWALPLSFAAFGKLQQTLAWDTTSTVASGQRGTLASIQDGEGHLTAYADWMRSVPQSVTHADSSTESAVVNDLGWITSRTDENGYTTGYTYDAMGRLASIVYPTGDTTTWNATTQVFEPVASVEHGIAAGHWRQTVATGNGRKVTWYDGLWRPLLTREYDTADPSGTQRYQRYAYDHAGRTIFAAYPATGDAATTGTHAVYDALGRPTTVTQDSELGTLTTTTEYLSDFRRRVTDARGNATTQSFLAWDVPGYDLPVQVDAPEDETTTIDRDVFGKPIAISRGATP